MGKKKVPKEAPSASESSPKPLGEQNEGIEVKEPSLLSIVRVKVGEGLKGKDLITKVKEVKPQAKPSTIRAMASKIGRGKL
ncbi:MAG: hypothetical protein H3Z52_06145 [archaeon]|nr:hypothetical protein [archaeon]MCP8320503.1 hypothetical protein [archaeon]